MSLLIQRIKELEENIKRLLIGRSHDRETIRMLTEKRIRNKYTEDSKCIVCGSKHQPPSKRLKLNRCPACYIKFYRKQKPAHLGMVTEGYNIY